MATISLQIGNYSNYVAAHQWNLHEAILCEDVTEQDDVEDYATSHLYRITEKNGEENRVPRTVVLDLRENVIHLDSDINMSGQNTNEIQPSVFGGVNTKIETFHNDDSTHVKPDWNISTTPIGRLDISNVSCY